ncbi:uncharacterized protein PV06_11149 [Exophiala oligosperma]|uniref:Uncharacterized protein n=1 Tax=Exophiala oligosperma TaxID=215243 RepID=A0A0D2BGN4_9EURO|nr:uncharacterized protein PV06_11149 [Exophiala oligosperma]KIW36637.1 hypothetical protein PV06_11149 [Exophiala oligosperma]
MKSTVWVYILVKKVICNFGSHEIAYWDRPRAALIRDNIYLEGGWMQTGTWKDGAWDLESLATVSPSYGMLFKLSLHNSFGTRAEDPPAWFEQIPEGGVKNYYLDGYMFADDDEFYAWGGMTMVSQNTSTRTVSMVLYDDTQSTNTSIGLPDMSYKPQNGSFITATNGAGANAPSERRSFYFGGFCNDSVAAYSYFNQPKNQCKWLITVDMSELGHATWSKRPLNGNSSWRSESGLVWVPTSTAGILVVIGGVIQPADTNFEIPHDNHTQSITYLEQFPIYDIGSDTWSTQMLNADSPVPVVPLAQFCTVVASSPDSSHQEIFVYGGWDSNGGQAQDTVWILTVPSFTWVKASSPGRIGGARQNHVCVTPYPDQMIVVGGTGVGETPPTYNTTVDVFSLNTFTWTGRYDPDIYDEYKPHPDIQKIVSATPTASYMSTEVASWFDTKYDMNKVRWYGPYQDDCKVLSPRT